MGEAKTKPTGIPVDAFIQAAEPPARRDEGVALAAMMARVTGEPAAMWGPSIVGFGRYHYRYESGRTGEMCRVGFSPRKAAISLYVDAGDGMDDLLARLGPHTIGKSCLYVKKLAAVDAAVLEAIVARAWQRSHAAWPD